MTPAPFDVEAIRKRCEAATSGPWFTRPDPGGTCECGLDLEEHAALVVSSATTGGIALVIDDDREPANSDFIAHARTDLPAALAEIERLTEENATLSDELTQASLVVPTLELRVEKMRLGLDAVLDLVEQSGGVYGLHRNGDFSPWDELRTGGQFESWLLAFDDALNLEASDERA